MNFRWHVLNTVHHMYKSFTNIRSNSISLVLKPIAIKTCSNYINPTQKTRPNSKSIKFCLYLYENLLKSNTCSNYINPSQKPALTQHQSNSFYIRIKTYWNQKSYWKYICWFSYVESKCCCINWEHYSAQNHFQILICIYIFFKFIFFMFETCDIFSF